MRKIVIFSEKHDYLLIAAGLALALWSFYGTVVAIVAGLIVIAVVNLHPIKHSTLSTSSSALLATAFLLVLSIGVKLFDKEGYCYAFFGPEQLVADAFGILMPCFPGQDFYGNTDQAGGMGYVRDIGLPVVGFLLGALVLRTTEGLSRKAWIGIAAGLGFLLIAPPAIHLTGLGRIIDPVSSKTGEELQLEMEKAAEERER